MNRSLRINIPHEQSPTKGQSSVSSPYSQRSTFRKLRIHKKISDLSNNSNSDQLWNQSSMSLTRDHSPVHKIPDSNRFIPIEEESLKNGQFLTLELGRNIKSEHGTRFPKSQRPEHFVKGLASSGPSPASYTCSKFLEDGYSTFLQSYNPESGHLNSSKMKWSIKGRSFSTFSNYHKSYINHSKHKVYQPENVKDIPGPGKYNHSFVNKKQQTSYTMRSPLKRFNQTISVSPGPGAYGQIYTERNHSPNAKRTIPLSQRTYLTKFEDFPSAHSYQIPRFLG